jgi:hypothetical protein
MKTVFELIEANGLTLHGDIEHFAALVAAAENEACAKVCEAGINNATDWDSSYWDQCCENRAAAIRARGNK